jgi:hypothetical protein
MIIQKVNHNATKVSYNSYNLMLNSSKHKARLKRKAKD